MATVHDINQHMLKQKQVKEQRLRASQWQDLKGKDLLDRLSLLDTDVKHHTEHLNKLYQGQERSAQLSNDMVEETKKNKIAISYLLNKLFPEQDCVSEIEDLYLESINSRRLTSDDIVKMYDTIVINFTGFIDGKPAPQMSAKNKKFTLDPQNHTFIPDLETKFFSMHVGEKKRTMVKFPKDYQSESNDEFAKSLSEKEFEFELEVVSGYRNKNIDANWKQFEKQEREKLLKELNDIGMTLENIEFLSNDQLKEEIELLKKDFKKVEPEVTEEKKEEQPNVGLSGIVYSASPVGDGKGQVEKLPDCVE